MPSNTEKSYYEDMKPSLLATIAQEKVYYGDVLRPHLHPRRIERLLEGAQSEFIGLLDQLPFIGGRENVLTRMLIGAVRSWTVFSRLEVQGLALREIARIGYGKFAHDAESTPPEAKRRTREFYFSQEMKIAETMRAAESQSEKYEGDWKSEFVDGDGVAFDFGIDFTECALIKFLAPRDALRFMPIFCLSDYATYRDWGIGFRRTQSLVNGAPSCDFRFKKDWQTPCGWPPEDLDEGLTIR
jgi:hypothetical protein